MTQQEQQLIDGLIQRIRSTPVQDKDSEADRYLQQNLSGVPDALYVLAQTVLVQQYGLQNAQSQMESLQSQLQDAQAQVQQLQSQASQSANSGSSAGSHSGSSFLSHLFGSHSDDQPQPPSRTAQQNTQNSQSQWQPVNAPPPPAYGQQYVPVPSAPMGYGAPVSYGSPIGGGGGFLRGALQTAAGVAAGEMMFQGMEGLFRGFEHPGNYSAMGGGGYDRPTEVINNNYYDTDRPGAEHHDASSGSDNSTFFNPGHDASSQDFSGSGTSTHDTGRQQQDFASSADTSDQGGNTGLDNTDSGSSFNDDTSDTTTNDTGDITTDDMGSYDDTPSDDSSAFDDSGSFDDGGGSDDSGFSGDDNSGF